MAPYRVHVLVFGKVQGVGFRNWVRGEASARGLHGWVSNRDDGSVEIVIEGDEAVVHELVDLSRRGPAVSKV